MQQCDSDVWYQMYILVKVASNFPICQFAHVSHVYIIVYLYIVYIDIGAGGGVWLKNRYGSFRGYKRFDLDLLRRYLKWSW